METNENIELIKKKLEEISSYLQQDNGGIEFVKLEDNFLYVRLTGECQNCPMSILTLRAGVERAILREFPFIKRVESVK
ncbi:MAG TPA: NifU family protein [Ignavibacteriales bacterium]|nr:NifU family protein [Ignavibacteriales bacterium]HOL82082.1 NifU family protein [Ignavibacteriales bacterium]HOM66147.1 NifU family protein [Ignavibacteriales bacterium]HPD66481.1 NifU family protein [Ignavibacteriales bacterium]HPP34184.1 NifU family protein [Ignavibacteriales bacterium]